MKVYTDIIQECVVKIYKIEGEEVYIDIAEKLYNEYIELEKICKKMKLKLNDLHTEWSQKMMRVRKERKIKALKEEIIALEK